MKIYYTCSMPNWTCCPVIILRDWHFWGFGFISSSNISLSQSVSWQHVCAVTSGFPHWVGSCVKTSIQYICQGVSSLNLAGLHFLPPSLAALFPTLCRPPFFFFFLSLFLESPSFSHRAWCWRLGHCFLLEGNMEGGGRQADFLAASFGSLSVWEKAEETDVMMTEELSIQGTDFSSKTLDVVILLRHECLNNCVIRLSAFFLSAYSGSACCSHLCQEQRGKVGADLYSAATSRFISVLFLTGSSLNCLYGNAATKVQDE